jgi:hypothetical protein
VPGGEDESNGETAVKTKANAGSLDCAIHDEAVNRFGRDDAVSGYDKEQARAKAEC